jgi:geranylgeranyl pyrophosphate synthase
MRSANARADFERALDAALARYAGTAPITEQIRYHFTVTGARLRSAAVLAVIEEEDGRMEVGINAACAIEILYNYWLVHGDIEEGGRVRGGQPTIGAKWGLAHGINAGDSLCAIGYLTLLASDLTVPAEQTLAMTRALHEANLAMCSGAASDLAFEPDAPVSRSEYLAMVGGKTASLFGAACQLGALAAGVSAKRAAAYAELGEAYGYAYHIEDDVLHRSPVGTHVLAAFGSREAALAESRCRFQAASAIAHAHQIDRGGRVRELFTGLIQEAAS